MPSKFPKLTALLVAAQLASGTVAAAPHDDHHHHAFAKDVDAFHAVLAPLWHARPGKERSRNTCAKTKELANLAGDIRSTDAKPLLASIATLDQQCRKAPADIDGAFHDVHEAFHRLAEPKGH